MIHLNRKGIEKRHTVSLPLSLHGLSKQYKTNNRGNSWGRWNSNSRWYWSKLAETPRANTDRYEGYADIRTSLLAAEGYRRPASRLTTKTWLWDFYLMIYSMCGERTALQMVLNEWRPSHTSLPYRTAERLESSLRHLKHFIPGRTMAWRWNRCKPRNQ